ncbi:MAG: TonB-dependent receptor [Hyphomicrobiaceae bacterium]|nr:TonB-dependent receptor [Hyphomicrobiaceae bacterium]
MFASVSSARPGFVKHLLGSAALVLAIAAPLGALARADDKAKADVDPLKITVTANRVPTQIARSGSSVTIIDQREIERSGASTITDVLERVPGVDFGDNGGIGSATSVRIRGMDARHTLVLIDGVRVGDVSSTGGETNFGMLDLSMVERIEVVRGPQSALYGSDAMGGVVNIITKSGKGPRTIEAYAEGGSYATRTGGLTLSGSHGPVGVAVGGTWFATDGYSRTKGSADRDQAKRATGHGRVSVQAGEWLSFDAGYHHWSTRADFDNTFGVNRDGPNTDESDVDLGRVTTRFKALDGKFNSAFTVFAGRTERQSRTVSDFGPYNYGYTGDRVGFDLINDINWGAAGVTVFGGSWERTAYQFSDDFSRSKADEGRRGIFLMHQLTIGDRLHLSAAGRIDEFGNYGSFPTWRATAAYDIYETQTRLRASAGTGAKAPSLYQRYGDWVGNTALAAETSFGAEFGVEQAFWNGRASATVTGFYNAYKNFIDYDFTTSRYEQIGRARMFGIEASGRVDIIEGMLEGKANYTWLNTEDDATKAPLARRPEHAATLALIYTGIDKLRFEVSVTGVGERFDRPNSVGKLDPYARVDLKADYQLTPNVNVYGRVHNLFNADYESAAGYNTAGISAYAGVRVKY